MRPPGRRNATPEFRVSNNNPVFMLHRVVTSTRDSAERERALGPFEARNTDLKGHSPTLELAAGAWSLTLRDHRSFSSLPACHVPRPAKAGLRWSVHPPDGHSEVLRRIQTDHGFISQIMRSSAGPAGVQIVPDSVIEPLAPTARDSSSGAGRPCGLHTPAHIVQVPAQYRHTEVGPCRSPHPLPTALTAAQRRTPPRHQRTLNYEEPLYLFLSCHPGCMHAYAAVQDCKSANACTKRRLVCILIVWVHHWYTTYGRTQRPR